MGWEAEEAEAAYWCLPYEERLRSYQHGIDFSTVIEEADMVDFRETDGAEDPDMHDVPRWSDGVPVEKTELPVEVERYGNAAALLGMDEADAEAVQQHLVDSGVFPVAPVADLEGHQPAPEPTAEERLEAAIQQQAELIEVSQLQEVRGSYVPAGAHDLLAARFQQERTARLALEQELEGARRLIGQGPFAVVKLASLNALTDAGQVEVRVGFGGGVTRHMLRAVLSLGQQAVADEAARTAEQTPRGTVRSVVSGEQGDTVRLPEPQEPGRPRCDGYCSGQWNDPDCSWHGRPQPAEKPRTAIPHPMDSFGHTLP